MPSFKMKCIIVLVIFSILSATAYIVGCKCDVVINEMSKDHQTDSPITRLKKFIVDNTSDDAPSQQRNASPSEQHRLLGRWTGPEGTYLEVVQQDKDYQVLIQDLETLRIFEGNAKDESMTFERDGLKEMIRVSNGDDTGMKWLSGKTNCITITLGEGYCKD